MYLALKQGPVDLMLQQERLDSLHLVLQLGVGVLHHELVQSLEQLLLQIEQPAKVIGRTCHKLLQRRVPVGIVVVIAFVVVARVTDDDDGRQSPERHQNPANKPHCSRQSLPEPKYD